MRLSGKIEDLEVEINNFFEMIKVQAQFIKESDFGRINAFSLYHLLGIIEVTATDAQRHFNELINLFNKSQELIEDEKINESSNKINNAEEKLEEKTLPENVKEWLKQQGWEDLERDLIDKLNKKEIKINGSDQSAIN